jgi:hypothetical protein
MLTSTTTIRVSRKTRDKLHEVAQRLDLPMQEVVEQALELYDRQKLLEATNAAYAALRADPVAWQEFQTELAEWDVTLNDGLEGL